MSELEEQQLSSQNKNEIYSGYSLNSQEIFEITSSELSKIILLAGPPESGKTTILSFLNKTFQKGSFGNYSFAGSLSLLEFEKCSYESRTKSGRKYADTARTQLKESKFLHLDILDTKENESKTIFFTDISGEKFREIKDSSQECLNFSLFKRCDSFSLLFDGAKLKDPKLRNICKYDGLDLLRSCKDSGMLPDSSILDIIYSKYDLIQNDESSNIFIEEITKQINNLYKDKVYSINFFKISARSRNKEIPTGFGIYQLFENWLNSNYSIYRKKTDSREIEIVREFNKYVHR